MKVLKVKWHTDLDIEELGILGCFIKSGEAHHALGTAMAVEES